MDGIREWATTTVAIGKGHKLDIVKEIHFPNSLGLLYSAFTYYTGFRVNIGEYKVMGLAPYGEPIRKPDTDELTQFHMDIAASVQAVTEKVVSKMTRALAKEYNIPNL